MTAAAAASSLALSCEARRLTGMSNMPTLSDRLRRWAISADAASASDIMDEAAAEIDRLRLTDAELEAIRFFSLIDGPHNVPVANKRAATLRGLLERTK